MSIALEIYDVFSYTIPGMTAKALGADTQIDHPAQDGQMAQQPQLVHAVGLGEGAPAAAATGARQGAFDGEDELAILGDLRLANADIGDVERNRDQRVRGHQKPSFRIKRETPGDSAPSRLAAQPLHLGMPTATPEEPKKAILRKASENRLLAKK
jgi:hypothetical protein